MKGRNPDVRMLPRVAVAAVVVQNTRVLLIKRRYAPHAGLWTFPGGKVRWQESLVQAVAREVWEETQVRVKVGAPLYIFDLIDSGAQQPMHFVIVDFIAHWLAGTPSAADDAAAARWFERAELSGAEIEPRTQNLLLQCWDRLVGDPCPPLINKPM